MRRLIMVLASVVALANGCKKPSAAPAKAVAPQVVIDPRVKQFVDGFVGESVRLSIHNRAALKEVNLKALGQFDFDSKGATLADVPTAYRKLDGEKVLLEGEIYDPTEAGEVTHWQLVYNIQKCCFNGPPRVQERVYCTAPPGKSFPRGDGYNKVFGTLHVTVKQAKLPNGSMGEVGR